MGGESRRQPGAACRFPTLEDWQRETRSLQALAAYRHVDFSYAGTGDPRNVPGVRATPDLFTVLQAQALLGRTFTAEEAVVGADRVVVLSHGFWTRVLGADARHRRHDASSSTPCPTPSSA